MSAEGSRELPPLGDIHLYAEAGREWTSRVPADAVWNPFEVRLIEDRMKREVQLKAALDRAEAAEAELAKIRHHARTKNGCSHSYKIMVLDDGGSGWCQMCRAEKAEAAHQVARRALEMACALLESDGRGLMDELTQELIASAAKEG